MIKTAKAHWPTMVVIGLLTVNLIMLASLISTQSDAPEDGRKVLCIGILSNTENPAREDSLVQDLCADVGITKP